jgi:beta-xylosidase
MKNDIKEEESDQLYDLDLADDKLQSKAKIMEFIKHLHDNYDLEALTGYRLMSPDEIIADRMR